MLVICCGYLWFPGCCVFVGCLCDFGCFGGFDGCGFLGVGFCVIVVSYGGFLWFLWWCFVVVGFCLAVAGFGFGLGCWVWIYLWWFVDWFCGGCLSLLVCWCGLLRCWLVFLVGGFA